MNKLITSSLVVLVLLLGVGLYLGQARDVNTSGALSLEEMGKIKAGGTECTKWYDGTCPSQSESCCQSLVTKNCGHWSWGLCVGSPAVTTTPNGFWGPRPCAGSYYCPVIKGIGCTRQTCALDTNPDRIVTLCVIQTTYDPVWRCEH